MLTLKFNHRPKSRTKYPDNLRNAKHRAVDVKLLRAQGKTQHEVAKELGISRSAVVTYMKKYNIK
jgi:DNA-binding CsgD family transcriptional regulator